MGCYQEGIQLMNDNRNRNVIIAIVVVLLLCCCCAIFLASGWFVWGDPLAEMLGLL